ncbi:hypothetical protein FGO68_gene8546 [Halteria grandinella]|uniref:Uncharacterized protein n=1 Tax=Halteria grandinella TaxID=5974 RepID=A0A8J8NTJ6_HALGN|nr:hypothetical protein FGO68_gene8546 [Halteria grandinella]
MTKRTRQQIVEERDPLSMVANGILNSVLIPLTKQALRDATKQLAFEGLIEVHFLKLFNNVFMPNMVRQICQDTINDEVLQQQANELVDLAVYDFVPEIAHEVIEGEYERREKEEVEVYAFDEYVDRCIMEALINQMVEWYSQGDERDIHTKELIDKKKREDKLQKSIQQEARAANTASLVKPLNLSKIQPIVSPSYDSTLQKPNLGFQNVQQNNARDRYQVQFDDQQQFQSQPTFNKY